MKVKYTLLSILLLFVISATGQNKEQPKQQEKVPTYSTEMPVPGYDFNKYLNENLHYPNKARRNYVQGRVIIKYIVTEEGRIDSPYVYKGIDTECDEEALRVVKEMPAWKPGMMNGKAIKVHFTLPIAFKLE